MSSDALQGPAYPYDAITAALTGVLMWRSMYEAALNSIADMEQFISSLAAVDGAVVLTKQLKVLGFGAEIIVASPDVRNVRRVQDPEAKVFSERPIDSFGTRHRSALRLCTSFEEAMYIVISQDGFIRIIKRVEPHLYMWDASNLGRFVL